VSGRDPSGAGIDEISSADLLSLTEALVAIPSVHPDEQDIADAVERRLVGKQTVWVLKGPGPDWSWVGSLRRYSKGKSHRLSHIRRSISQVWAGGHRA